MPASVVGAAARDVEQRGELVHANGTHSSSSASLAAVEVLEAVGGDPRLRVPGVGVAAVRGGTKASSRRWPTSCCSTRAPAGPATRRACRREQEALGLVDADVGEPAAPSSRRDRRAWRRSRRGTSRRRHPAAAAELDRERPARPEGTRARRREVLKRGSCAQVVSAFSAERATNQRRELEEDPGGGTGAELAATRSGGRESLHVGRSRVQLHPRRPRRRASSWRGAAPVTSVLLAEQSSGRALAQPPPAAGRRWTGCPVSRPNALTSNTKPSGVRADPERAVARRRRRVVRRVDLDDAELPRVVAEPRLSARHARRVEAPAGDQGRVRPGAAADEDARSQGALRVAVGMRCNNVVPPLRAGIYCR